MKKLLLLSIITLYILSSCTNRNTEIATIQSEYLNEQLIDSFFLLAETVKDSGSTPQGVLLVNHSVRLVSKADSLQLMVSSEIPDNIDQLVTDYINFAQKNPDSITIDHDYLLSSLEQLNTRNADDFNNLLKLFTIEALHEYHLRYLKYSNHYK